ncbi:MAG: HAD family hydrolase [Anaerolineae bacterium]|nr:HAD family hydrolase [Anaerolineae bacterium]
MSRRLSRRSAPAIGRRTRSSHRVELARLPGALRPGCEPSARVCLKLLGGLLRFVGAQSRRKRSGGGSGETFPARHDHQWLQRFPARAFGGGGWSDRFDPLLISEEVGLAKPDGRIFEMALEQLEFGPEEVLYVGDSLSHDREGCLRAGISFCHFCPGAVHDLSLPSVKYRIGLLSELASLLLPKT